MPEVARAHMLLARDFELGAGERAELAVAGAVGEQLARIAQAAARADVLCDDGGELAGADGGGDQALVEEQCQVLF